MFHRFVSLALIICFLPLPGFNSAEARELACIFCGDSSGDSAISDFTDADDSPFPRIVANPVNFETEVLVFCSTEKEGRENESESKDGEEKEKEKSFDDILYFCCEFDSRISSRSLRTLLSDRMQFLETFYSRYHILRC